MYTFKNGLTVINVLLNIKSDVVFAFPGGAELSEGDGLEGEHAPGLPGHLPPRGAAAQLHRATGGDGLQPGHPRVEEVASHRFPCAHAVAAGQYTKRFLRFSTAGLCL